MRIGTVVFICIASILLAANATLIKSFLTVSAEKDQLQKQLFKAEAEYAELLKPIEELEWLKGENSRHATTIQSILELYRKNELPIPADAFPENGENVFYFERAETEGLDIWIPNGHSVKVKVHCVQSVLNSESQKYRSVDAPIYRKVLKEPAWHSIHFRFVKGEQQDYAQACIDGAVVNSIPIGKMNEFSSKRISHSNHGENKKDLAIMLSNNIQHYLNREQMHRMYVYLKPGDP